MEIEEEKASERGLDGFMTDKSLTQQIVRAQEASKRYSRLVRTGGTATSPLGEPLAPAQLEQLEQLPNADAFHRITTEETDEYAPDGPKSAAEAARLRIAEARRARKDYERLRIRLDTAGSDNWESRAHRRRIRRKRVPMSLEERRLLEQSRETAARKAAERLNMRGERGGLAKLEVGTRKEFEQALLSELDRFDVLSIEGLTPAMARLMRSLSSNEKDKLRDRVAAEYVRRVRRAAKEYTRRRRGMNRRKVFSAEVNAARVRSEFLNDLQRRVGLEGAARLDAVRESILGEMAAERAFQKSIGKLGGSTGIANTLTGFFRGTAFAKLTEAGVREAASRDGLRLGPLFVESLARTWGQRLAGLARTKIANRKATVDSLSESRDSSGRGMMTKKSMSSLRLAETIQRRVEEERERSRIAKIEMEAEKRRGGRNTGGHQRTIDASQRSQPVWQAPAKASTDAARRRLRLWAIGAGIVDEGAALAAPLPPAVEDRLGLHLPRIPVESADAAVVETLEATTSGADSVPALGATALTGSVPRPSVELSAWAAQTLCDIAISEGLRRKDFAADLDRPLPTDMERGIGPADPAEAADREIVDQIVPLQPSSTTTGTTSTNDNPTKKPTSQNSRRRNSIARAESPSRSITSPPLRTTRQLSGTQRRRGMDTDAMVAAAQDFVESQDFEEAGRLRGVASGAGRAFGAAPRSSLLPRPDALDASGAADRGIWMPTSGDIASHVEKLPPGVQAVITRAETRLAHGKQPDEARGKSQNSTTNLATRRFQQPPSRQQATRRPTSSSNPPIQRVQSMHDLVPGAIDDPIRTKAGGRWWELDPQEHLLSADNLWRMPKSAKRATYSRSSTHSLSTRFARTLGRPTSTNSLPPQRPDTPPPAEPGPNVDPLVFELSTGLDPAQDAKRHEREAIRRIRQEKRARRAPTRSQALEQALNVRIERSQSLQVTPAARAAALRRSRPIGPYKPKKIT